MINTKTTDAEMPKIVIIIPQIAMSFAFNSNPLIFENFLTKHKAGILKASMTPANEPTSYSQEVTSW